MHHIDGKVATTLRCPSGRNAAVGQRRNRPNLPRIRPPKSEAILDAIPIDVDPENSFALRDRNGQNEYDAAMSTPLTYKSAGLDLDLYDEAMERLPPLMKRTHSSRVIDLADGFAGLFRLFDHKPGDKPRYRDPVLVSGTS